MRINWWKPQITQGQQPRSSRRSSSGCSSRRDATRGMMRLARSEKGRNNKEAILGYPTGYSQHNTPNKW